MTKATSARLLVALPMLLGCLFLAAGPAFAQSASSTFTTTSSGTVGTPTASTSTASAGDFGTATKAPEAISCSGSVKLGSVAVNDPLLPPQVVVSVDTRSLSCVGQSTKTVYLNSGQANLTRPLVASDVIKTTFAVYPNTADGYTHARTAMVTLNLTFDTTTGALTGASASIGNFQ